MPKKFVILILALAVSLLLILSFLYLRKEKAPLVEEVALDKEKIEYHNMAASPYAFYKALEIVKRKLKMVTTNAKQKAYFITTLGLENYEKYKSGKKLNAFKGMNLDIFSEKELMGFWIEEGDIERLEQVKKIVIDRGFGSSFAEKIEARSAISILKVLMQWKRAGEKTKLVDKEKKVFDAVFMQNPKHHFNVYKTEGDCEIIELETKSDDKVYITMTDEKPFDNITIIKQIKQLKSGKWDKEDIYDQIRFPMVDFTNEPNISYFNGLCFEENEIIIEKIENTFLKVLFKMNEIGAKAEAVAVVVSKMAIRKKELIIDKPFILWLERPGLDLPVVAIYCDKNYWKDPGEIKFD